MKVRPYIDYSSTTVHCSRGANSKNETIKSKHSKTKVGEGGAESGHTYVTYVSIFYTPPTPPVTSNEGEQTAEMKQEKLTRAQSGLLLL